MKTYRAAVIGCSRMGGFIDNEVRSSPTFVGPYSHGAGYHACGRTDLVACSDLRTEVMEQFGKLYRIPHERQYTDYRELIAREQPDIVSVATQPEQRAEIVVHATESGARAIYAEKAMAASMDEADAMVEACERNGVFFNLGTNRRWDTGFDAMKELMDDGRLGRINAIILYETGTLFNSASHWFDLAMRLNSDHPAQWVQARLLDGEMVNGDVLTGDPRGHGMIHFQNGVTVYALLTGLRAELEVVGEQGTASSLSNGAIWQLRRLGAKDSLGRAQLVTDTFPQFERASSTLRLIEDLVHSLDTGEPTRGGVRVARASTELLFAFIESHMRSGARVDLPLEGSKIRLRRDVTPGQPKYG